MRPMLAALVLAALSFALPVRAVVPPAPVDAVTTPEAAKTALPMVRVALETRLGRVVLELDPARAPQTVANFLAYVDSGHYNGTVFHRVVPNLLVQGGAFTPDLQPKPDLAPIALEADNGLKNLRGTVAAARRPDTRDSATSQFFINVVDSPQFDAVDPSSDIGAGYAVFGRVVEGMDVIDRMRSVETGAQGPFGSRVPTQAIVIERAQRIEAKGA